MQRRNLLTGVLVLTLSLIFWGNLSAKSKQPEAKEKPATVVEAAKAKQQEWYDEIKATGTLSAFQGVTMKPEVSGRVTAIYFEEGTSIEKGKPIIQIFPNILEAELDKAEAAEALAKIEFERAQELYKKKALSKQDRDIRASEYAQTQASVDQIRAQLTQYNITAPFSGRLGLRLVDLGEHLSIGQPIVNLQQLDPIRVEFSIPEVYLDLLALGQTVELTASSDPNKTYQGQVYAFDSIIDPETRSLNIRAKIPNEKEILLPGTFVRLSLLAGEKHPVITVPQTALVYSPEAVTVYKIENSKAVSTKVTIGIRRGSEVEIKSGLKVGEQVVTAGQMKLTNNAPVKISDESPSEPNSATQAE